MQGYFNKKITVDLTRGIIEVKPIPDKIVRSFIGGSGLATRMLYDHIDDNESPDSPQSRLYFSTGPFTGTPIPSSGRHAVVGRSPLTGIFGESDVGGRFGAALKKTGTDLLEITGRSRTPVYLFISDTQIRLEPGDALWGKDTYQTADRLSDMYGKSVTLSCIGPAGENRVPLASIMHDGSHGRAAGRCGLGCLMGSKNLKAVVASGNKKVPVADPERLNRHIRNMTKRIKSSSAYLRQYGTSGGLMCLESSGDLPVKNFSKGRFPEGEQLTGERLAATFLSGRFACGACPIGCGREVNIPSGKYGAVSGAGPEYETMASLGAYCLVDDLEAVCTGNELCNRYGMDTISVGAAIAFAMEGFEKGIITSGDAGGVPLKWGDPSAMLEMIRQIGEARQLGAILGKGVRAAARVIGGGSEKFALHIKGLELPGHDPRAYFSQALSYATSNRGACHLAGLCHGLENSLIIPDLGVHKPFERFSETGKAGMVVSMQNLMGVFDSLKTCKFLIYCGITPLDLARCLELVTGQPSDLDYLMTAGERMFQLKRLINCRLGVGPMDDDLPERIKTPLDEGGTCGRSPDIRQMLKDYYALRDWTSAGTPSRKRLMRLGLTNFGQD